LCVTVSLSLAQGPWLYCPCGRAINLYLAMVTVRSAAISVRSCKREEEKQELIREWEGTRDREKRIDESFDGVWNERW
jgi:hypothetical protein